MISHYPKADDSYRVSFLRHAERHVRAFYVNDTDGGNDETARAKKCKICSKIALFKICQVNALRNIC